MQWRTASDVEWLIPVLAIVAIEYALWWIAFNAGFVFAPLLGFSGVVAFSFLLIALLAQLLLTVAQLALAGEPHPTRRLRTKGTNYLPRLISAVIAIQVLTMAASAFAALKGGIPKLSPFWLDVPLAEFEHSLFGMHPWELSHLLFGKATLWIDRIYSTFVPLQTLALVLLAMSKPSEVKSRAIVTIAFAWVLLGIFGAYLLSSAGPIFYDRVFGGNSFNGLIATLSLDAPMAIFTADALWQSYQHDIPTIVNGISAMPSMHVAGTFWFALVVRKSRFAVLAWLYYAVIWLGSVHLGWHYVADGLVSSVVVLLLWKTSPRLLFRPRRSDVEAPAATT